MNRQTATLTDWRRADSDKCAGAFGSDALQTKPRTWRTTDGRNVYMPFQNVYMPFQNVYIPLQNVYIPLQNVYMPFQNVYIPLQNVYIPFGSVQISIGFKNKN